MKDYYKILEVSKYSTQDEIKKAYRAAVRKWHPDKNNSPEAHEKIVAINEAYEVLSDTSKRYWYDEQLNRPQYHYQPPPAQPKPQSPPQQHQRPNYKQREKEASDPWWPYARVPVIILWLIILVARNVSCNNKPDYDITHFKYPVKSSPYSFDVDSLGNTLNIYNIDIDGSIETTAPFLAFEKTINGIVFSEALNNNLNRMYNYRNLALDSINTIVVYDYIYEGDEKVVEKTNKPELGAKVYFIHPKTSIVYKTDLIKADSTSVLPDLNAISHYIIQESIK